MDSDSRGALLVSSFWSRALGSARALEVSPWLVPFDPRQPVHTPNTLDTAVPFIAAALADAVLELEAAGILLGAPERARALGSAAQPA